MMRKGTQRRRALLIDSEPDTRSVLSRYLQLHGMDVVEAETLRDAQGHLSGGAFDLMVAELATPEQADWSEWKGLVTRHRDVSLLVHGKHPGEWSRISIELGRRASFLGRPFSLSDFHWALHQLL